MRRSWRERIGSREGPVRDGVAAAVVLAALLLTATPAEAQSREEQAFLRSAATHFRVEEGEVAVLARGSGATPEEIPLVLHIATGAGVSAEAILALRRSGRSWSELLRRYGMHAGQLHVPLESDPVEGPLAEAYREFAARPRNSWPVISLSDQALVSLVNLHFLTEYLDVPPERVARALTEARSPVQAYRTLLGGAAS